MDLNESINIKIAIDRGIEYLVNNQHKDGSVSLERDSRWIVWETANAIIATILANKKKAFIKKGIQFLLNIQREDGSFYHTISFEKDKYCMETTAVCIFALSLAKIDVSNGINFILKKQESEGSWEIGTPEIIKRRFWPSITGFVLSTLLQLNILNNQISKGINYLKDKQHEDGSWGSNWVYYDTPYYPMHSILLAFKLYGLNKSIYYKKAESYILKNQSSNGSWHTIITNKPNPSRSLRTVLALNSLLVSPNSNHLDSINKAMIWILKHQENDGYWDGGYFVNWPGKKEDIYTTSMAVRTLIKYKDL